MAACEICGGELDEDGECSKCAEDLEGDDEAPEEELDG